MKLWIFVLFSYSKRRLDHLSEFVNIHYFSDKKRYCIILKPDAELPILEHFTIPRIKQQFRVLCDFWEIYSQIYGYMNQIYFYKNDYDPYVQIYTSLCFLIGWIIPLCHII